MSAVPEQFTSFSSEYNLTAYDALEAHKDMSQGQLKRQWWKRMQKVHPDKGGDTRSAQMVNEAWDILKEPGSKERYDAFLQEFPDAQAWGHSADAEAGAGGDESPGDESPGSSQGAPPRGDLAYLRSLGFSDVSPAEVDELKGEVDRASARALWSYTGFWFKRTVPIADTMHFIVFILFFMAGDIAQTAALLGVMYIGTVPMGSFVVIPCLELLLTMGIGVRIYYKQVLVQCEYWNMEYVLGARAKYWVIRGIFALILCVACFYRQPRLTNTFNYIVGFRLFLAASQYLAHNRARRGSWVFEAVGGPKEHIPERRTNLLLYYDSWLNSFLMCMLTSLVGSVTLPLVLNLLLLDLFVIASSVCCGERSDRDRGGEDYTCCALACLVLLLDVTSSGVYKFANWRLKNMQQEWDKEDGKACDKAYLEWALHNFERRLEGLKRKRERARAQRAKKESEKATEQQPREEGEGEFTESTTESGDGHAQAEAPTAEKADEPANPPAASTDGQARSPAPEKADEPARPRAARADGETPAARPEPPDQSPSMATPPVVEEGPVPASSMGCGLFQRCAAP